jgi:predicted ATPase
VRLVTLSGPGGVGKTRLALQVAAELSDDFADGVFVVALAPVNDPTQVVPTIAQTLAISQASDRPLFTLLQAFLKEKQLLLLLDNFEQVADAAVMLAELLAACPRLKVVVTSRMGLHVRAEHEFVVPPLSVPTLKHLPDLKALSHYKAVTLFIERAQAMKPDFSVTNGNAPAVAAICAHLDGLPLAIELAAARVKHFSPHTLLARLEQGLSVLSGGARDLPTRQQTLPGAMTCSHPRNKSSSAILLSLWMVGVWKPPKRSAWREGDCQKICWKGWPLWWIRACCDKKSRTQGRRAFGCCRRCASSGWSN